MMLLLDNGEVREVRPGQALMGLCVTHVEVSAADVAHPLFREWFNDFVLLRFVPAQSTEVTHAR